MARAIGPSMASAALKLQQDVFVYVEFADLPEPRTRDFLQQSHLQFVLTMRQPKFPSGMTDVEIAKSELVEVDSAVRFSTPLRLPYNESAQLRMTLRLMLVQTRLKTTATEVRTVQFSLNEAASQKEILHKVLEHPANPKLPLNDSGAPGSIHVRTEIVPHCGLRLGLTVSVKDLPRMDPPPKWCDPFFVLSRKTAGGALLAMYTSERKTNVKSSEFQSFNITYERLAACDPDAVLRLEFFDKDKMSKNDIIGSVEFTAKQLFPQCLGFQDAPLTVLDMTLAPGVSGESGACKVFLSVNPTYQETFLEYIRNGVSVDTIIGVDLTSTTGMPDHPASLHYTGLEELNQFEQIMVPSVKTLLVFSSDRKVCAYGCGVQTKQEDGSYGAVEHCIPIGSEPRAQLDGETGLQTAYRSVLGQVRLSTPLSITPILERAIETARLTHTQKQKRYHVLLLQVASVPGDLEEFQAVLGTAEALPISVTIVCVGARDFTELHRLDEKLRVQANGATSHRRDMVQVVSHNRTQANPDTAGIEIGTLFTRQIIDELPYQLEWYFQSQVYHPIATRLGIVPAARAVYGDNVGMTM